MSITIVCDDIRSTYNIGSILRTADGFGVKEIIACGLTPYIGGKDRPPHIRNRHRKEIAKTALGAEEHIPMHHKETTLEAIRSLREAGYHVVALEQSPSSVPLETYEPRVDNLALVLGAETIGLSSEVLEACDEIIEIPMHGMKESFNVSVACGITLYQLTKN